MARGERLIKLENSWFSAKSIEVERIEALSKRNQEGRELDGKGWPKALLIPRKLRIS